MKVHENENIDKKQDCGFFDLEKYLKNHIISFILLYK